jgi:hypothetical protein
LERVVRDCIADVYFGVVVLAYYLEERSDYILYFPLFGLCCYGYYHRFRFGESFEFNQKILGVCTAWNFIILFSSYLYITFLQMYN